MVPMQLLPLEDQVGYHAEDNQGDDFLYDFQLHQREWTTIINKADSVGRHQETVLYAGNHPREGNHGYQGPVRRDASLVELQVSVPCKCHKDITANEQ